MKKYQESVKETIITDLNMTVEEHTRKQVQMHIASTCIAKSFSSSVPVEFGEVFHYNKVYYAVHNDQHVTIEEYVDGQVYKYVNNDDNCMPAPIDEMSVVYKKAQCLVQYSYVKFQKRLMLLDLQGSYYMLYDPEIATSQLVKADEVVGVDETLLCIGNLSTLAIDNFREKH